MRWLLLLLPLTACSSPELGSEPPSTSTLADAEVLSRSRWDRMDVLFVLDNSISMVDEAPLLNEAIPALIGRLAGSQSTRDVHVGFITSSVGSSGGDTCADHPANSVGEKNDHAHLMGYLDWTPGGTPADAVAKATSEVTALGHDGCGFEAPLEAWYRFLVDPKPPEKIVVEQGEARAEGIDEVLLAQRHEFLRPDSFLLIVMLTDENDCSVDFRGHGWLVGQASTPDGDPFYFPPATSACEHHPTSPCCRSCASSDPGLPGCLSLELDPACKTDTASTFFDHLNLRCFDQKRRFGTDFLYPTRRYVEALSQPQLTGANGEAVVNPLFVERGPNAVHLMAITGVPWQDIATDESLSDPAEIEYRSSTQLENLGRFDWLTPECLERGKHGMCDTWDLEDEPDDPLVSEAIFPRKGTNPATDMPLVGTSGDYLEQPINGHEHSAFAELQYSCIYPLREPRDCTVEKNCPCKDAPATPGFWSDADPVCQTTRGDYSTTQRFARAYPATRQLEVVRELREVSSVASICPKLIDTSPGDRRFAYNPALDTVLDQLEELPFRTTYCLRDSYPFAHLGASGCRVLVDASELGVCGCAAPGFAHVSDSVTLAARKTLGTYGRCDGPSTPACASTCICELEPTQGGAGEECERGTDPFTAVPGFCGVAVGAEANDCVHEQNALRFVGLHTSHTLLIYCE